MKGEMKMRAADWLVCILMGILSAGAMFLQAEVSVELSSHAVQKELFSKGVVRLISELTITDETLGEDYFGEIYDLALDNQGALYVCDSKAKNIKKFDASGKFVKTIGKGGQGPGEFEYPYEVEVFRDRLIVRDLMGSRISLFDLNGKYLSSVPIDRKEGSWRRFRALPDGRFIVETEFIDRSNLNSPQEMRLALHAADFSFAKTIYRKTIFRNKYISEPVRTNIPIPFAASVKWDLTPEGKIVIGYSGNYEIEILDPDKGKIHSWTHPFVPVGITGKDKEEYFAGMTTSMSSGSSISTSKGAPEYIVKNTEFPKTKPAFERLIVDGNGSSWVFLPSADPKAKPTFEAFDPKGAFLGRVVIEGEWPQYAHVVFHSGGLWMVIANTAGEIKVVKARISNESVH